MGLRKQNKIKIWDILNGVLLTTWKGKVFRCTPETSANLEELRFVALFWRCRDSHWYVCRRGKKFRQLSGDNLFHNRSSGNARI